MSGFLGRTSRWIAAALVTAGLTATASARDERKPFEGQFFTGEGDAEYLELLDVSRRMFAPDPEFQNVGMLYTPAWNGFVEGPTWGAWWIQNSYGPTYCALPFYDEPLVTFLQNAQDLWFDQMGDGQRQAAHNWVPPDGCLCDAASPGWFMPKQGDGRVDIHDWGMEFTAAGLLMQAEALLISRDRDAADRYLPKLRRCAAFIESRRDAEKDLFLAGPAGNLLAPSYAGYRKADGTYGMAYLAGLSVTYIAALDRLIELEKLAGDRDHVELYTRHRDLARKGLSRLVTEEGYFVKSIDPDGTRHGVFGAPQHGYFEAVVNHDAICFRVAGDEQAENIYRKIAAIPGLRPHDLIITNYPSLDDMYVPDKGWLWQFGTWVNGGHWSTCEARMMMGYYRLGRYEDARRSMRRMMHFARAFRMDNPLVGFGAAVYQPNEPINLCYDSLGPPAAMIRGLFEYLYRADELELVPHVPPKITRLQQHFPVRFGGKRLYLATAGSGPITGVVINGKPWTHFDARSIRLPYDETPEEAAIEVLLGGAEATGFSPRKPDRGLPPAAEAEGKAIDPACMPVISTNTLPLRIGADSAGNSRFLGDIGRARVYGRALRPEEIAQLARDPAALPQSKDALLADWDFTRREGDAFSNSVGDDLPAKIVGKVEVVESPQGKAVRLAGEGYLEVAHDKRLDLTQACTLEAWICPKQMPQGGGRILDKSRVGTSNGYLFDTYPGNSLRLIVERGVVSYDARLEPGHWVHVAATAGADGSLALYLDGKQVAATKQEFPVNVAELRARAGKLRRFHERLVEAGLGDGYEAAHARLAVRYLATFQRRMELLAQGKLARLPEPSQYAADKSYLDTAARLCQGLEKTVASYEVAKDAHRKQVYRIWTELPEE